EGFYKKTEKDKQFVDLTSILKKYNATAVLSLMEDLDNRIWIGTFGQGIIIYDPKNNSFKRVLAETSLAGTILKMIQTKNVVVLVTT
ncbi:UNVERIFIED_CONTAM: hypothetical protein IGO34_32165, partial [Salmonella enterica subsp. enterica serovar Weltevreden]